MKKISLVLVCCVLLAACGQRGEETPTPITIIITATPNAPDNFPANMNPLTGQVVDDPSLLERRPLLVKVSNESADVRPQSGLSFADHVWQHQMEDNAQGTRYTAVFYSRTPEWVGSVRSARLPDVDVLVPMYGGLLAFSGGSSNLADPPGSPPRIRELVLNADWANRSFSEQTGTSDPYLVRRPDIPRSGTAYYHSLFANPSEIWRYASQNNINQRPDLSGLVFIASPLPGGEPVSQAVVDYPAYGPRHTWQYDSGSSRWLQAIEGEPYTDYLTGQQLAFENVVILYDEHYQANFLEDDNSRLFSVGFHLQGEGEAIILRDGMRYNVTWQRSTDEMVHFVDSNGQIFPLKPGTTWFHVCATNDNYQPTNVEFTP